MNKGITMEKELATTLRSGIVTGPSGNVLDGTWFQMCLPLGGFLSDLTGPTMNDNSHTAGNERNLWYYDATNNGIVLEILIDLQFF